jgi:hypothetical protein
MKKLITNLLLSGLFLSNVIAQSTQDSTVVMTNDSDFKKEIGIRMSNFSDFDFFYKKQIAENKYMRLRLVSANFSIVDFSYFMSNLSLGMTYGREKRKSLDNDFYFIKGWEIMGRFNSLNVGNNVVSNFTTGVGMVFGFQYEVSEKFVVNIETIPSISTRLTYDSNHLQFTSFNIGFNTSAVALGFLYRF